jgi:two-component system, LytTR family, sensor kinase
VTGAFGARGRARWVLLAAIAVGLVHAVALLLTAYVVFGDLARGEVGTAPRRLAEELVGGWAALALIPGVLALARRFPVTRATLKRSLPAHALGLAAYSVVHTALLAFAHDRGFRALGLEPDSFVPRLGVRAAQELAHDVVGYAGVLVVFALWDAAEALEAKRLREAELEGALTRAQLHGLRLQLQPHFLFNALNTVSAVMYDDPAAAEAMLSHLAELLRRALEGGDAQEVPLGREVETLGLYTGLLRARFGDRLRVDVDVEPEARGVPVPPLLLQPLVENAVRHGGMASEGALVVRVRVRCREDSLEIEVSDDGPGAPAGVDVMRGGIGLSTSAERLRLLYGEGATFRAGNGEGRGFRVLMRVPRPAPAGSPPQGATRGEGPRVGAAAAGGGRA